MDNEDISLLDIANSFMISLTILLGENFSEEVRAEKLLELNCVTAGLYLRFKENGGLKVSDLSLDELQKPIKKNKKQQPTIL